MKKKIPVRAAGHILIGCLLFLMIFHLLVALHILPGTIVWGGTLAEAKVAPYETAAFIVSGVFLFVAFVKAGYIGNAILKKTANVGIRVMVVYFALSIIGNTAARTVTERVIFIPLSAAMFITSLRLAIDKGRPE